MEEEGVDVYTKRCLTVKHRKSKAGCLRCKAKRVKCSETIPKCRQCMKNATQCVYPQVEAAAAPIRVNLVNNNHLGFNLQDMRLFHDFMTVSYPHLPLESEQAWLSDIPVIAQQHEYLMHAILALGAAHLHGRTELDLMQTADRHRTLALEGLNYDNASNGVLLQSDSAGRGTSLDAALATCYLLTFTSSYLGDPVSRFLILVRGCSSMTLKIIGSGHQSPLIPSGDKAGTAEPHLEVMQCRLLNAPPLLRKNVEDARASLDAVPTGCNLLPFQWGMLMSMRSVIEHIDTPPEAYRHFIDIWNAITTMPPEDFDIFTNNDDIASVVLQAHFLALERLLAPWLLSELSDGRQHNKKDSTTALTASATLDALPQNLLSWPMRYLRAPS